VNQAIQCSGNTANALVTASNIFSTTINSGTSFSFSINSFYSPPTSQPVDAIVITSYTGGSAIDTCNAYVTGLIPKVLSSTSFVISDANDNQMVVNSMNTIKFGITTIDVMSMSDYFIISFPAGTTIDLANTNIGSTVSINSNNPTFLNNNLTLYMTGSGNLNPQTLFITLTNFIAPPSTKTTNNFTVYILSNGYPKMVSYQTITCLPSTLSGTVSLASPIVNSITSYSFTITILDALTSTGKIKITFPNQIILKSISSSCAVVTGNSLKSTPNC